MQNKANIPCRTGASLPELPVVVGLVVDLMVGFVGAFVRTRTLVRIDANARQPRAAATSCLPLPPPLAPRPSGTLGMPPLYRCELAERVRQAHQRVRHHNGRMQ